MTEIGYNFDLGKFVEKSVSEPSIESKKRFNEKMLNSEFKLIRVQFILKLRKPQFKTNS